LSVDVADSGGAGEFWVEAAAETCAAESRARGIGARLRREGGCGGEEGVVEVGEQRVEIKHVDRAVVIEVAAGPDAGVVVLG